MFERKKNNQLHTFTEERLSAYTDNRLPPLERVRVERHLAECVQCQHALSSLEWTVSLLKQAPAPALPRSFTVPVPKQPARSPIIGVSFLRLAAAVATLLLISLVGIDVITQLGGGGMLASSAPHVAVAPTQVGLQSQEARPAVAATQPASDQTTKDQLRAAATAAKAAATAVPPAVGALPAAQPTGAPKPTMVPPTSAPAATAAPPQPPAPTTAPAAGASLAQIPTSEPSRPSARTLSVPGSPTPSVAFGKGGGNPNEKSTQDSAAATAAPMLAQPRAATVEPSATPTVAATETPLPPTPTLAPTMTEPAAVASPTPAPSRREALVQPTNAPVPQPTTVPSEGGFSVSPLRIAELAALFAAVFLGVLALMLRK